MKYTTTILVAILFCGNATIAQTKFSLEIQFPVSLDLKSVTVSYDNGYEYQTVDLDTTRHSAMINGISDLSYPLIVITSGSGDHSFNVFKRYVLLKKNARITFANRSDYSEDKLLNAVSILDFGERRFNEYAKNELDSFNNYLLSNAPYLSDSIPIANKYNELSLNLINKRWEFIKSDQSFFSLWMIKDYFTNNSDYSPDTVLNVYNQYYAKRFSKTPEAGQIISALKGRQNTVVGKQAPLFKSLDYKGRKVDLSEFRGKKYVILNFWATWCGSCMEEMPVIDTIFRKHSDKGIEIISISNDDNFEKCKQVIQKQQMDWTNIIKDLRLKNTYGNFRGIPQVFLLDKSGKIIYSRAENEDSDLQKLLHIVEGL